MVSEHGGEAHRFSPLPPHMLDLHPSPLPLYPIPPLTNPPSLTINPLPNQPRHFRLFRLHLGKDLIKEDENPNSKPVYPTPAHFSTRLIKSGLAIITFVDLFTLIIVPYTLVDPSFHGHVVLIANVANELITWLQSEVLSLNDDYRVSDLVLYNQPTPDPEAPTFSEQRRRDQYLHTA